jgi:hypothetical protein
VAPVVGAGVTMAAKPLLTLEEFRTALRSNVADAVSLRSCARALGISAAHLSNFLNQPARRPGAKLLAAVGYENVPMFRRRTPKGR